MNEKKSAAANCSKFLEMVLDRRFRVKNTEQVAWRSKTRGMWQNAIYWWTSIFQNFIGGFLVIQLINIESNLCEMEQKNQKTDFLGFERLRQEYKQYI